MLQGALDGPGRGRTNRARPGAGDQRDHPHGSRHRTPPAVSVIAALLGWSLRALRHAEARWPHAGRGPHRSWCRRASDAAELSTGSAWRGTIFHSPFSRRKIVLLRRLYGVGSDPRIDAVVRSIASR